MSRPSLAVIALVALLAMAPAAVAQEPSPLPANVTFAVSTGYWEEQAGDQDGSDAAAPDASAVRRGYYKLYSLRQPDGTAQIHLQRIEATPEGPAIASSTELEEFSAMKAYVTDIRPESSDGVKGQPGMFATIHLKTDPQAAESTAWTVLIDDLGELKVEKASN
ncbi:hypothetical protein GGQ64_003276 [Rhizobium azooxidifex]|uniref:Lipoprotein n=1 Tax=Mycoplana azooxidifex TaxID=1636188 RepID=A0A7W6GK90_9HYPH|nr:hypothetical protein [Mycoplana azooxidifex]